MSKQTWVECSFLIPIRRDSELSDGRLHKSSTWKWLDRQLFLQFGGRTVAPELYQGVYRDPDTMKPVNDLSRRYIVAIPIKQQVKLRTLLATVCQRFQQKCIYLSVAGIVDFVTVGTRPKKPTD